MAPRVSGYVSAVQVADNQAVKAGQLLVKIDPSTYQAALAQQIANRDSRQADVVASEAEYQQQLAGVEQARTGHQDHDPQHDSLVTHRGSHAPRGGPVSAV